MFSRLKTFLAALARAGAPARNPFAPARGARG